MPPCVYSVASNVFIRSYSTLSSSLNSLAAITVETFITPMNPKLSETKRTNICKVVGKLLFQYTLKAGVVVRIQRTMGLEMSLTHNGGQ